MILAFVCYARILGGVVMCADACVSFDSRTRPDILNAVRAMERYSAAPELLHWQAALHIVMNIKSTSAYGITF